MTLENSLVRIDNQESFDNYQDTVFTQPSLERRMWWRNFWFNQVKESNPNLTDQEIDSIVLIDYFTASPLLTDFENCNSNPNIDFDSYTLLGISFRDSGCFDPELTPSLKLDKETQVVKYRLFVEDSGQCRSDVPIHHHILVEKLPNEYAVEHEVILQ